MAEIRKHNPATNQIADAVRAAAGETIRPVTPGPVVKTASASAEDESVSDVQPTSVDPAPAIAQLPLLTMDWLKPTKE